MTLPCEILPFISPWMSPCREPFRRVRPPACAPAKAQDRLPNFRLRLAVVTTYWRCVVRTYSLIVFLLALYVILGGNDCRADSIGDKLRALEGRCSITIEWRSVEFPVETTHGSIDGSHLEVDEFRAYASLFVSEFQVYPPPFVRKCGLQRVVLCKDLAFNGQLRTAVPEFGTNTLYLDGVRGQSAPNYQRTVIHHEFFHMLDYRDDGQLYRDDRWTALNEDGFSYGPGGASVQDDPSQSQFIVSPAGFLTRYSTAGVEEDKAELFAHLIVNPHTVAQRKAKDRILKAKVSMMKTLLNNFSCEMDEDFWSGIRQRQDRDFSANVAPNRQAAEQPGREKKGRNAREH